MIPTLYKESETVFDTNGIGKLSDCISCYVTEKRNSSYELEMEYPDDGIHADSIEEGRIILAKPSPDAQSQPFRIYKITTPLSGILKIYARHISYHLNYVTISPFSAEGCDNTLAAISDAVSSESGFSFETGIKSDVSFSLSSPESVRNCLGGIDGSVLDTFGGEYEWDRYTVILHRNRGADNGVRIVYGKNLVDFTMEKNIEDVITGVHPYWMSQEDGTLVELPEKTVVLDETAEYQKITVLDCSEAFEEEPAEEELRSYAESYLESTTLTEPELDIDIDFAQLWQLPGYEDIAEAESVSLCDTVHVYITRLGIEVSCKVTETGYDVLLERYKSITLSNSSTTSRNGSLTATISSIASTATTALQTASAAVTYRYLDANYITTDTLAATYASLEYLTSTYATLEFVHAEYATIADLTANTASISDLQTLTADITSLLAGTAGVGTLEAIHLTSDNVVIDDAVITSAMIASLTADKITSGTIYTSLVTIQTAEEDASLYISGSTLQINDGTRVRVQIGEDAAGDYNMYLWDASGNLLWDALGLTEAGVSGNGGIIKDVAVADDAAIQGTKLDIASVASCLNEDGSLTIDYSRVVIDDTTLSAWYTTVNSSMSDLESTTSTLQTELTVVQGQITSKVWQSDIDTAVSGLETDITTLQDQYSAVTQTVSGIITEVGELTTTVNDNYSALSSRVTTVETTVNGITSRVSSVESALGDVTDVSSFVASEISQLADSISLSVSGSLGSTASIVLSVDGTTSTGTVDLTGIRSAFASDTSAIAISAGTVTFNSNTLVVNSSNFTLDSSGNATFGGTLKSPGGTIGGWTIGTTGIYYNTTSMSSTAVGTFIGPAGFRQYTSSSKYVNIENGELVAIGAILSNLTVAYSSTYPGDATVSFMINNTQYGYISASTSVPYFYVYGYGGVFVNALYIGNSTESASLGCGSGGVLTVSSGLSVTGAVTISKTLTVTGTITGTLSGTATRATYLGSSTVGGTAKPIYLSSGTATACSSTVGGSTTPVYMSSGTITACSSINLKVTNTDGTARYPIGTSYSTSNNYMIAYINSKAANSSGYYYVTVNALWASSSYASHNIVSASSDIRLKANVRDCETDAMPIVRQMKIRQFDWKYSGVHQEIGFVADELEEISTNFAVGGGYDENGDMNVKSINTLYLLGYVVKGIQEMDSGLTAVTTRVNTAESRMEAMQVKLDAAYDEIASLKNQIKALQASA